MSICQFAFFLLPYRDCTTQIYWFFFLHTCIWAWNVCYEIDLFTFFFNLINHTQRYKQDSDFGAGCRIGTHDIWIGIPWLLLRRKWIFAIHVGRIEFRAESMRCRESIHHLPMGKLNCKQQFADFVVVLRFAVFGSCFLLNSKHAIKFSWEFCQMTLCRWLGFQDDVNARQFWSSEFL